VQAVPGPAKPVVQAQEKVEVDVSVQRAPMRGQVCVLRVQGPRHIATNENGDERSRWRGEKGQMESDVGKWKRQKGQRGQKDAKALERATKEING